MILDMPCHNFYLSVYCVLTMHFDFVMDQCLQSELSVSTRQSNVVDADWIVKYSTRQESNA